MSRVYLKTYDRTQYLTPGQLRLFEDNIPLARFMAMKSDFDFNTAFSLSLEGLELSARKFLGTGCSFGTFAAYTIRSILRDSLRKQNRKKRGDGVPDISLEAPVEEGSDQTTGGLIPCPLRLPSEEAAIADDIFALEILLLRIDPRSRRVLENRYGLYGISSGSTSEVARRMGISKSRVSQLELQAVATLRTLWKEFFGPIPNTMETVC